MSEKCKYYLLIVIKEDIDLLSKYLFNIIKLL